jgi:hypothetical protein
VRYELGFYVPEDAILHSRRSGFGLALIVVVRNIEFTKTHEFQVRKEKMGTVLTVHKLASTAPPLLRCKNFLVFSEVIIH